MNAIFVITASSCCVRASGKIDIDPTVPWIVSSMVSPVKTLIVRSFSLSRRVPQDCMSFEIGTFSGNQKFAVSLFQTSRSIGSSILFQLTGLVIADMIRILPFLFPLGHSVECEYSKYS